MPHRYSLALNEYHYKCMNIYNSIPHILAVIKMALARLDFGANQSRFYNAYYDVKGQYWTL